MFNKIKYNSLKNILNENFKKELQAQFFFFKTVQLGQIQLFYLFICFSIIMCIFHLHNYLINLVNTN